MSVAPDVLLKPAAEVRPKTPPGKAPAKPAEPSKNEGSSFSQVYAKERQAGSAERADGAAKPSREKKTDQDDAVQPQADAAAAPPPLAESGNALPSESADEPPIVDPLLLLGLNSHQSQVEVSAEVLPEGEGAMPLTGASLVGSGPASLTEASLDPELEALNQVPAVRMALDLGAKAKEAAAEQQATTSAAAQATLNAGQGFAGAMAAMAAQQSEKGGGESAEVPLLELTAEGLESLKESSADNRPENFVSKLSALSQAIGQQSPLAPRAALVPGQPVAMQQGGWSEAVVDRVMWLSSQNLKSAEIQLDPAELGRLEVRINMAQDQTQVTFASPNAGVRDALEGQMHRLRELFAQQGMNLLDVNVSDQSLSRGWQGQEGNDSGRGGGNQASLGGLEDESAAGTVELPVRSQISDRGLVDYYA
ncbi:flagellar hook-length control protein FliK [Pseudomonas benzenivorans]|uniref:Flagellar hook-length control protein FliK n=1 Tax=Pseudomonas benzenivorans TaxID=556533 RepID=A0ABY5H5E7_9PSED|nr:flagellar hook-length control protein FliK [Pseudomonas benzenivorans]UTW07313.1 flagellar hook-length control protein FliK [Pseudomonas benzenivorans]